MIGEAQLAADPVRVLGPRDAGARHSPADRRSGVVQKLNAILYASLFDPDQPTEVFASFA
jgi:hypothetical protein